MGSISLIFDLLDEVEYFLSIGDKDVADIIAQDATVMIKELVGQGVIVLQ